jgi:putative ABC transport system ATP-binding protein
VGLSDRLSHRPFELSGGERQRVGMARAVANDPALILADEPTGNLDGATAANVIALLEELRDAHGCTLLVATHDPALAHRADRLITLVNGRVSEVAR